MYVSSKRSSCFSFLSPLFLPILSIKLVEVKKKRSLRSRTCTQSCIDDEHHNLKCHWELGWVYWLKSDWDRVVEHWSIVRKIDPNYKTVQKHLPQAEAKQSSRKELSLSVEDVTATDDIYRTQQCLNRSDSIRSRTQKYQLNQNITLFLTDCNEVEQGPLRGSMERLVIQKRSSNSTYEVLSLPLINLSNQMLATPRIIAARFEGGILKSNYRNQDWNIRRRWNLSRSGVFFLSQSSIINFSGTKKLDYIQGKRHKSSNTLKKLQYASTLGFRYSAAAVCTVRLLCIRTIPRLCP